MLSCASVNSASDATIARVLSYGLIPASRLVGRGFFSPPEKFFLIDSTTTSGFEIGHRHHRHVRGCVPGAVVVLEVRLLHPEDRRLGADRDSLTERGSGRQMLKPVVADPLPAA